MGLGKSGFQFQLYIFLRLDDLSFLLVSFLPLKFRLQKTGRDSLRTHRKKEREVGR